MIVETCRIAHMVNYINLLNSNQIGFNYVQFFYYKKYQ